MILYQFLLLLCRTFSLTLHSCFSLFLSSVLLITSAVGQTVGAFHRRDCRGDDAEILVARLIDRPIRPMIAGMYVTVTYIDHQVIIALSYQKWIMDSYSRGIGKYIVTIMMVYELVHEEEEEGNYLKHTKCLYPLATRCISKIERNLHEVNYFFYEKKNLRI